jgi:SAM-dependent methyltransferase
MMSESRYMVVLDQLRGYRRLDPLPAREDLNEFYHSRYYALLKEGRRGPELAKLSSGGAIAEAERAWLRDTLYADLLAYLDQNHREGVARSLLDVGCGTGEFMRFASEQGRAVHGLELSPTAVELARAAGLSVDQLELEEFVERADGQRFGAITMLHVLEHVPEPAVTLAKARSLLEPNGLLLLQVPNDFNVLQAAALPYTRRPDWWVAIPDHVNYFDGQTLSALVQRQGFDVVALTANFPMEFFLLMGDDYIDDPEMGKQCHQKRVRFERALEGGVRRKLYQALAAVGMGRDVILLARRA